MTIANVKLWGRTIGAVSWDEDRDYAYFEFDPQFVKSGIQIAPLTMPLSRTIFSFPGLARETFYGLPGMLADSLPDKFGNALINAWLVKEGRAEDSMDPVAKLCYISSRGMGALEYSPAKGPRGRTSKSLDIDALVTLASEILTKRGNFLVSLHDKHKADALRDILQVGTSAGGARAKALIAWNPNTKELKSGQIRAGENFTYWLLKFDGVAGNGDKELDDPRGYGLIEYSYYKMALLAGIAMPECRLLEESGRHHFMAKRFDRADSGDKLHMQSLCAMAHYDFNQAGVYSYEQAIQVMKLLDLSMTSIEEQYRRMAFNIVGRNQDDHVKNIAYVMDKGGTWSLSPGFDLTYAFNPGKPWTRQHQMSMNGKRDNFTIEDFDNCAKNAGLKRGRHKEILEQVQVAVSEWPRIAREVGVPADKITKIEKTHRFLEL